ncbi:MAG: flagellar export protein FliJ [Gemmatimonadaceae bacterium]
MSADRFTFRLGRLLSMRERHEADAAVAFATASGHAAALHDSRAALLAQQVEVRANLLPAEGGTQTVGNSRLRELLLEALDVRATGLAGEIAAADAQTVERRQALSECLRDRRVLEKLRERQQESWRVEAARRERDIMDEAAQRSDAVSHPSAGGAS